MEFLLTKVIEPAMLHVNQSNAGTLPESTSRKTKKELALEAKMKALENRYMADRLTAKEYLDELASTHKRCSSNAEDEVASETGSVDNPEEVIEDLSDWEDFDDEWFTSGIKFCNRKYFPPFFTNGGY